MQLNIKKCNGKSFLLNFLDVNWLKKKLVRKGTILRYGKNSVPYCYVRYFCEVRNYGTIYF